LIDTGNISGEFGAFIFRNLNVEAPDYSEMSSTYTKFNGFTSERTKVMFRAFRILIQAVVRPGDLWAQINTPYPEWSLKKHTPALDGEIRPRVSKNRAAASTRGLSVTAEVQ
jgi:hypothetical protein